MRLAQRGGYNVGPWKGAYAMIKTPYGHKVYAMAAEYPSAAALYEAESACGMLVSGDGTCFRHFRFTEWTKQWGSANRG